MSWVIQTKERYFKSTWKILMNHYTGKPRSFDSEQAAESYARLSFPGTKHWRVKERKSK